MKDQRIGLFGGSFDPVHLGHLIMAQDAAQAFGLDRLFFIPACQPPHKLTHDLVTAAQRVDMLRLALGDYASWEVSDAEISRGGVSYSIDTIRHFAVTWPEATLFWIIGGDTLPELHTWKAIDELMGLCRVVTVARPDFDPARLAQSDLRLRPEQRQNLLADVIPGHMIGVSSTEIRMRVAKNEPIRYLVPEAVAHYIHEHGLYTK